MSRGVIALVAGVTAFLTGGGLALSGSVRVAPSRFELLSHVEPGEGTTADVFARKGHAYLSSHRGAACASLGVRVYDMRTPRVPVHVSTFAHRAAEADVAGSWTEKTIVQSVRLPTLSGELAVTSFQSCRAGGFQGFGLYDVSDPARPRRLSLQRLEPRGSHEIWLGARGNRAYVYTAISNSELTSSPNYEPRTQNATTPGKPDFRIFDVTNPAQPVEVASWGAWAKLGIHPNDGRGFFKRNFLHSVITNAAATRAFLSYWDLGTIILDISNPANPTYLGRTPTTKNPEGDVHSAVLANNGKLLIETQESLAGTPRFFDISNPRRPRLVGQFKLAGVPPTPGGDAPFFADSVHDPKVLGKVAYFSWYRQGVVAVDITKPSKPRLVARFRPAAGDFWGVFATSSYILASDMPSGMYVLRLVKR